MSRKRLILEFLSKAELIEAARMFEVPVVQRLTTSEVLDVLVRSRSVRLDAILQRCTGGLLKTMSAALDLPRSGTRQALIARLVEPGSAAPEKSTPPPRAARPAVPRPASGARMLSIQQPWVHAILHLGKRVENRVWETAYRGPLYIHVGKHWSRRKVADCFDRMRELGVLPPGVTPSLAPDDYALGGIVARAELVGCVFRPEGGRATGWSPWHEPGQYGFELADVRPVPFVPCNGQLKLYRVPDELLPRLPSA